MNRGFAAFLIVMVIGLACIVAFSAHGTRWPTPISLCLAGVVVVTTGIKFALSDVLSSDGFNIEKTVSDIALALSAAFFSFAFALELAGDASTGQQADTSLVLSATVALHDQVFGASAATALVKARQAMWLVSATSLASVAYTTWLAWKVGGLTKGQTKLDWKATVAYRVPSVLLGVLTYVMYFALLLYKA